MVLGFQNSFRGQQNSGHQNTETNPVNSRKKPTMNTTRLITAVALTLVASGAALAQEATYDYPQSSPSQVSRSAVKTDLNLARMDGKLLVNEASVGGPTLFIAQLSRQAVRAEAQLALKTGRGQLLTAEPHDFAVDLVPAQTVLTLAGK